MKNALNQSLEQMLATARNKRLRRRVLAFLSAFVLLLTVNGTKFTADTLERIEGCGLAEHAHAAECYDADGNLTCGLVEHVHTDACYQTRPVKQTADEGEPDPSAEAVDAAPAELDDYALGDDAPEAAPEAEPAGEEAPADAAEPEYEYTVGEVCPVLLADIIAAVGLPVDASAAPEAWQVIDDAHPEGLLRIEAGEDGTAIYPTRSFDRAELAVIAGEDIYTVTLLNAVVPQLPQEAEAEAEPETETEPETIAETETVVDAEAETEVEVEAETEPETVVDAEPETETEVEAEADAEPETIVEPEAETVVDAEPETETETVVDTEPETEVEAEAETEPETVVDAEPVTEAEVGAEADAEPEVEAETEAETVVDVETESETEVEAKVDAELEVEAETETDAEPETETETVVDAEPDSKTEVEAEAEHAEDNSEADTSIETSDPSDVPETDDTQKPSPMGAKPSEQSERQVDQPEAETEEVSSSEPTDDPSAASDDDSSADPSEEPSDDDSSADPSEEPSDDDSSADPSEEPTDTPTEESSEESSDEPTDPEATDSPEEPSDDPTSSSPAPATQALYRADIDLTDAEAPFSLAGWVALAQPVEMEPEDAETVDPTPAAEETEQPADAEPAQTDAAEPATSEVAEAQPDDAASDDAAAQPDEAAAPAALPMEAWTIEYDTELFAIEPINGDYSVTPLGDFDAAEIAIDAGEIAYALTLSHWTGEAEPEAEPEEAEPELLSGAFAVPVEGADYALTVDVPEEAALPASATFVARAVEDDVYNRAALAAVAGDDAEDYIILAMFDLTLYDGDQVIKPEAALRIGVQFADATEADRQLFVVHFPGSGAQPESAEAEAKQPAMLKSAPKKLMAVRAPQPETELVEVEIVDGAVEFSADAFSMFSVLAAAQSEDVTGRIGETNQDNVPVYSGHNLIFNSQVDTIAEKGTRVTLLSTAEGFLGMSSWYQIGYGENKTTGYVEQKYIDIIKVPEPVEIESDSFKATVSYEAGVLPDGATLSMKAPELAGGEQDAALEALGQAFENKQFEIREIQYFDLTFTSEGAEIEPNGAVGVSLSMKQPMTVAANEKLYLVHFANSGVELVDSARFAIADGAASGVDFTVDSFSTFAVVKVIETTVMTRDGETYRIRVLYGDETGIPEDAELVAEEILGLSELYGDYVSKTESALSMEEGGAGYIRLFDISIVKKDDHSVKYQPAEGTTVDVRIELADASDAQDLQVVHFADAEAAGDVVTAGIADQTVEFKASSFSVYAVAGTIIQDFLSDSGVLYEVKVTYSPSANIPVGAHLKITEFSEDDEEYTYARNAVLADKLERKEWVDLSAFGLAALDISILDANDNEIEPEAPVQVDIRIKALPGVEDLSEIADTLAIQHHVETDDGVVVETVYDGSTDASFKLNTNAVVAAEGTAVDPNENLFVLTSEEAGGLSIAYEVEAFSTFTISWNNAYGNGVKVHYVDTNGTELTVNNTTFISNLSGSSASPAYLIYDIDGYEYDHTYRRYYNNRRWYEQNILPELLRHNASNYYGHNWNGWMYTTDGDTFTALNSGGDSNNEIYVLYKKKNNIVQGGTPTVKQSSDVKQPVAPRINKESTPNGDDTNTLALSLISDTAALEVEKLADVIVVFDVSGSMETKDMDGKTRLEAAQKAVEDLADQLALKKNSAGQPLVRMSLIQFSTKASTVLGMTNLTTKGVSTFKTAVGNLSAGGGTNWDHALQLANEENDLDSGRGTFVIFVTDGDPTFRNARMNVTDADLAEEKNYHSATDTYTDPNYWYLSDTVYGPGNNDRTGQCYAAAVQQGQAIVDAEKMIYTIGISNDVTKVQTFNSNIHGSGAYLASNTSALQQAFADIETSISGALGWGNIQMTDGITNLSNTVQKTSLTNVGGDFTYWMAPAQANWDSMTAEQKNAYKPAATDFVSWDPVAAGAQLATYNTNTGAVEWNMGSTFMPEAGVTYQVRFKVWPSQEAYDYIAKLNNETIAYDTLPDDVKAQIIKNGNTYTLKTNEPDAKTTYQAATKSGNTVTVSGETKTLMFPTVDNLNLSVDRMTIQKEWVNDLDPDSRWKSEVTLNLTDGNGNLYKSIRLNESNNYTMKDNFISCGLAKIEGGELVIYEAGHDFKLKEIGEYAYQWDLDSQIYRPMIIDTVLTMLVKEDAPIDMGNKTYVENQGSKYYKIGGVTYKAISSGDAAATITVTNIRRSNLNLTKKVVDDEGNAALSSEAFTFTITVNDAHGDAVWFSVQKDANDTNTIVKDLSTNATAQVQDDVRTGYYYANSGSPITVSMEPGWNLRFTNLPNGSTYTITETTKENYTFVSAVIDNNGTFSVADGTTTGSGTINQSNTQYTVTYTNRALTQQVNILKTSQDGTTPLSGAVFSLYTESGYNAKPKQASKTELISDGNGKIDLGKLAYGKYYLVETTAPAGYVLLSEPVVITVGSSEVTYTQGDRNLPLSGNGIDHNTTTDIYTLTVTNNAGARLPSTGGSGTTPYTLAGIALMGIALILLLRRRAGCGE